RRIDNDKTRDKKLIPDVRKICFSFPYQLFTAIEIFPTTIVTITMVSTGSHPVILLFKLGTVIFSVSTLLSSLFLIILKNTFYPLLMDTSIGVKDEKFNKKDSLSRRLVFQIFPSILVTALLIALIGYSRLITEKGNLLDTYYMAEIKNVEISENEDLLKQLETQTRENLLSENDFVFIECPDGTVLTSNNGQVSDFFIKYMHELSPSHNNRVYEAYAIDEQGVVTQVTYKGEQYTIGIHYEIVSFTILIYFLIYLSVLFTFNIIVLIYVVKSINSDLNNVTEGLKNIITNKENLKGSKLPITSNDIVGELVNSFNEIQELTKENIDQIHNNQDMLMERERLASLGQMVGGIAHNLKTPIMSIAGAAEGLKDLVNEYDASIGNPIVNDDDYHEIAKDMREWLDKISSYTEYMSDVITAVKGQTVTLTNDSEINFTIGELFKRVDILMKHELKNQVIYLNTSMQLDENTTINGNINSLVQVINNMISNSIHAYNGKHEQSIDLTAKIEGNNLVISVQDYGEGMPDSVKNKLFKEMITTKGKNGTGLGLYMSYSTIRANFNGDITVESEKGKGTIFNIIIPIN
ncbi:MAG: HAMP domain-containing histidine kinase, partial [Clostridia bacterium]|nr:HAMP domain-containing histidine kinase [Clostridia bacterium]